MACKNPKPPVWIENLVHGSCSQEEREEVMSAALTVQPRHLALPDACLVTPSQLSIPRSISKEEFLAVAAKLKALGQAEDFWLADAASFAKKWDDGLQLMAETVGRTKYHLVRVAQ